MLLLWLSWELHLLVHTQSETHGWNSQQVDSWLCLTELWHHVMRAELPAADTSDSPPESSPPPWNSPAGAGYSAAAPWCSRTPSTGFHLYSGKHHHISHYSVVHNNVQTTPLISEMKCQTTRGLHFQSHTHTQVNINTHMYTHTHTHTLGAWQIRSRLTKFTAPVLVLSTLQPGIMLDKVTIQLLILSLRRLSTKEEKDKKWTWETGIFPWSILLDIHLHHLNRLYN